jgi:hypothetical protein
MANALYPKSKAKFLKGTIGDLSSGSLTIKAISIDTASYTYSASHEFLSDVAGGARIKKSNPLTGKTINLTTGAFDSDDPTMESVSAGTDIDAIILYIDTGVDATSSLLMFQDTSISTVPFTPDGSDVRIIVDAAGWFTL